MSKMIETPVWLLYRCIVTHNLIKDGRKINFPQIVPVSLSGVYEHIMPHAVSVLVHPFLPNAAPCWTKLNFRLVASFRGERNLLPGVVSAERGQASGIAGGP